MSLSRFSMTCTAAWTFTVSKSPYGNVQQGPDQVSFALSNANLATYNEAVVAAISLGTSANSDLNLNSFTDITGVSVTATKVLGTAIFTSGPSTANLEVTPSVSSGLTGWFFRGTNPKLEIPCGGFLAYSDTATGTPFTLSAGVGSLNFKNTGTGTMSVQVVALVGA